MVTFNHNSSIWEVGRQEEQFKVILSYTEFNNSQGYIKACLKKGKKKLKNVNIAKRKNLNLK